MSWVFIFIGVGISISGAIVLIGAQLPEEHVATVTARIAAPVASVWNAVFDVARYPTWRPDVSQVELLPAAATGPCWREHGKRGAIGMVVDSAQAPTRLVTRIVDVHQELPFGGTWTFELAAEGEQAATITITERGAIYNPFYRVASRFIVGYGATLDRYVRALGKHFGPSAPT